MLDFDLASKTTGSRFVFVKDKIVDQKDLPMRFVASTPCFRKEAGSYGKDTKGMIRQHQFYKVEMVSLVEQENCLDELERMTNCATDILDKFCLLYTSPSPRD